MQQTQPLSPDPWRQNEFFWQRTTRLLGDAAAALFACGPLPARGVTVNTRLLTAQRFFSAPPFAVAPGGFAAANFRLLDADARPGRHPWHHAGAYYVQEPSASCAAVALAVAPGDRVLDLCAAPGGKSAQLAAALQGQGVLVSNEFDAARSRVLLSNSERMGAANWVVTNDAPDRLAQAWGGYFNKVLVDAPCSGEGMFRKEPQAAAQHGPALVAHCAALQAQILDAAARCLCPGGEMVYATCTFSPEEDEGQIAAFLARHPDFELLPTGLTAGCCGHESHCCGRPLDVSLVRRIYPCHGGEGHFVARLRRWDGAADDRNAGSLASDRASASTPRAGGLTARSALPGARGVTGGLAMVQPPPEALAFLRDAFPDLAGRPLLRWQDQLLLPPQVLPPLAGLHLLRCGLLLGSLEDGKGRESTAFAATGKRAAADRQWAAGGDGAATGYADKGRRAGQHITAPHAAERGTAPRAAGRAGAGGKGGGGRFTPAHHLMHACGGDCRNQEQLTADDPRTAAYLRGEEIAAVTAADGWCAVCVDGFALGAGKVSGGRIKNHYPKGLRTV